MCSPGAPVVYRYGEIGWNGAPWAWAHYIVLIFIWHNQLSSFALYVTVMCWLIVKYNLVWTVATIMECHAWTFDSTTLSFKLTSNRNFFWFIINTTKSEDKHQTILQLRCCNTQLFSTFYQPMMKDTPPGYLTTLSRKMGGLNNPT